MATNLLYMNDFEVTSCDARVIGVESVEEGRSAVMLDQTCFYPRGGGQDWDMGTITGEQGSFAVEEVRLDEAGVVWHVGRFTAGVLKVGDEVRCAVDVERRTINTRLHSAGHVVDLAVDRLGLDWVPAKGAHYPHMSFVEYTVEISPEDAERLKPEMEQIIHDVVDAGSENEIRFMPVSDMAQVCRHVPSTIPTNKPARVVIYCGDFGVPCGGTHVRNLRDVGTVHITKIKSKKGITKVTYTVEGIN